MLVGHFIFAQSIVLSSYFSFQINCFYMRTAFVFGFKHFGRASVVSQSLLKFGWIPKPLLTSERKQGFLISFSFA
jgi:hypothetical protein